MRIRSIKPEFWRSDDIDALCIEDRLLFIGLWSYVDDGGIGIDKESSIAADLFAGDLARDFSETSVRVHAGLKRLAAVGLITRYSVDGRRLLHIGTFHKHQRINRPTPSRHPGPTCADAPAPDRLTDVSVSDHGVVIESSLPGAGEQGSRGVVKRTSATADAAPKRDDRFDDFWALYPNKVKKAEARNVWKTVLRKKVDPDHVIAGLTRQVEIWRAEGREKRYTPHPTSWLRAGRWDDEVEMPSLRLVAGDRPTYQNPSESDYHVPMFDKQEKAQ